ncbi:predicted protein [Naegleria gruberi]|uniref:Predicted protein n=1 Tax=Naegleria gruberi TaxID=5762 RepID=D2W653_NAEGR|nr:uncharacterized protein NAEGRDRAFT_76897 [Naegleria gruberi]EFC35448.1 predicted protein [Naegleria gruberi]|eukprot:XP_002668192.1 predicted protein [Naegleria gruberi strain NEG-M]
MLSISTPLWILVFLLSVLIAIEYSKFQFVSNNSSTATQQPNYIYNNYTTIQSKYSTRSLETNANDNIKSSNNPPSSLPSPPIPKLTIQFISENVQYINTGYLQEKFTKSLSSLTVPPKIQFEFKRLKSIDEITKNSFFLLIVQSTRFHDEEREHLLKKYTKDIPLDQCAVIFVCLSDLIRLTKDQTMGRDVFSVKWNENVKQINERDEKTIGKLIEKIIGE